MKKELDELRKENADLKIQLAAVKYENSRLYSLVMKFRKEGKQLSTS